MKYKFNRKERKDAGPIPPVGFSAIFAFFAVHPSSFSLTP